MSDNACPLPTDPDPDELAVIHRLLETTRNAIVGASDNPSKPSYRVASYLKKMGKEIIPINPNHETVLGLKCYPALEQVPGTVELVDVFRRADQCPPVVRSAIGKGAKAVWLQAGIKSDEAREVAREAGIDYIEDRCLMVEHQAAL